LSRFYAFRGVNREVSEGSARRAGWKVDLERAVVVGRCSFFMLRREINQDARTGAGFPNREAVKSYSLGREPQVIAS
jgi:hypothetical protein